MKYTFICELPPPYGGVTVKNNLVLHSILTPGEYEVVDLSECKRNKKKIPVVFGKLIRVFIKQEPIVYGLGSYRRLEYMLKMQYAFGGTVSMQKTVNFVMGGNLPQKLEKNPSLTRLLSRIKINYVETVGMMRNLADIGINNAKFFPNARNEICSIPPQKQKKEQLSCVFFSQISAQKGVPSIFEMIKQLPEEQQCKIHVDFYGHIVDEFQDAFSQMVERFDDVCYCGVFDSVNNNVYQKLNEYDVLLLPTLRPEEGVPGILVEAKMAGLCPVVTDCSYNKEVVRHEVEGLVMKSNDAAGLTQAVLRLMEDSVLVDALKEGSYQSRMRYAMEAYVDIIRGDLGI